MINPSIPHRLMTLVLLMASLSVAAAVEIDTRIQKSSDGSWSVHYELSEPVLRLQFVRQPDTSRQTRWYSLTDQVVLESTDDEGFILHSSGKLFSTAVFRLTPTYTTLPKDYAPFSPYSDGGMLFHSGRFFVCAERCDGTQNEWRISVKVPDGDNIVIDGEVRHGVAVWVDSDSGRNVYVGPSRPVIDDNVISVIDPGLPQSLKSALSVFLPQLMHYFSEHYGDLDSRPMLFASRSETTNGRYGQQGGVLPQQVFMHWYGPELESRLEPLDVFWFFAHEIAHLYQKDAGRTEPASALWIHEGAAEFMASLAVRRLMPDSEAYLKMRMQKARESCIEGLAMHSLQESVNRQRFDLYYSCGLLLHAAIDRAMSHEADQSQFHQLWQAYSQAISASSIDAATVFFSVLQERVPPSLIAQLRVLIFQGSDVPASLIDDLENISAD